MDRQRHTSDTRILDARTLEADFPALVPFVRSGLRVLDVGCGTGAITAGIATRVGSDGLVVGIDRDVDLVARAAERASATPWLRFERSDVLELEHVAAFDVVAVARTLQWIDVGDLGTAVSRLARALAPGGHLVALDYNHRGHKWRPEPPQALARFMDRFRAWREARGWQSDVLPLVRNLCADAGLSVARLDEADDVVGRGAPRFQAVSAVWPRVIETIGPRMAAEGFQSDAECAAALAVTSRWCDDELMEQTMAARVLTATRQTE